MRRKTTMFLHFLIIVWGVSAPHGAWANPITFDFTGRLTVVDPSGSIVNGATPTFDPYGLQAPISASLVYDNTSGLGSATLIVAPFDFFGSGGNTNIYDINLTPVDPLTSPLILGNMLADWATFSGIPISLVWNASGLVGAINQTPGGLQVGDVIRGNQVLRGGSVILGNIGSAIPATDGLTYDSYTIAQGPAPLATTSWDTYPLCDTSFGGAGSCLGTNPSGWGLTGDDGIGGSPMIDGPAPGFSVNLDIGSGNSMVVTAISGVPVPAAMWLFASGLLGLAGVTRRRRRTMN